MKKRLFLPGILLTVVILLEACIPGRSIIEEPDKKAIPDEVSESTVLPTEVPEPTPFIFEDAIPAEAISEFSTDFSRRSVSFDEILSGGPPKDGIPSIDSPRYVSIEEADEWIESAEPVIALNINNEARAYPIQILMWHEIANDFLGGEAIIVTFCPLCNTAIVFDRTVSGRVLDFGTTGRLRYSNLIMYDRETETWWQQATGEAIIGELWGKQLKALPAAMISWMDFMDSYPGGDVLSRETGYNRSYGTNPYSGYDDIDRPPFLYGGPETPDVLSPLERVFTLELDDNAVAYPYKTLEKERVVNDTIGTQEIVVMWNNGTASALDSNKIALGRDVGTVTAFYREIDGKLLTFLLEGDEIVDQQTRTIWNILGFGIEGLMKGSQLRPVVGINHFWFSWAAFRPDTEVYGYDY